MEGITWITSLGSTGAAIVVVILFLKHLTAERESREKHSAGRDQSIKECVDHNGDVIEKNTEVLGQTLEVLRRINGHLPAP